MILKPCELPDVELVRIAREGDRTALEVLCERHRGIVVAAVDSLKPGRQVDRDDLHQAGYLAVIKSVMLGWNPEGGSKLSTYIYAAVRNAVGRELQKQLAAIHCLLDPGVEAESVAAPEEMEDRPDITDHLPPLCLCLIASINEPGGLREAAERNGLTVWQARRMLRQAIRKAQESRGSASGSSLGSGLAAT